MKLYDIISNLKFVGIKNYREIDIDALTFNSKEKLNNGMFFCIKGLNQDGHDYAIESLSNGSLCLVVERYLDINVTQILVENARVAMSYIASIFYSTYKSKMKFIGITGTNGKTTTCFVMREILQKLGKSVGLIGTEGIFINNLMLPPMLTTPDPIALHKTIHEMELNGCEYCLMEVSAHAIALNKIDNIYYDVVGLTNITQDHLDFFVNMENYVKCKLSLFNFTHAKVGVVNLDNKYCKDLIKKAGIKIVSFGKDAEYKIDEIKQTFKGTELSFHNSTHNYKFTTNLLGEYNAYNMLMAIICLNQLGFDINDLIKTIKLIDFIVPGRFNMLKIDAKFNVVVDYAHTPDGFKNILSTLKKQNINRLITVFGCGGNRDKSKRKEMGTIAGQLSDIVVVTTDNPRNENPEMIIDDILENPYIEKFIRIVDRKNAIEHALNLANENDVVAILGKGNENYQEIKGVKIPFSDYDVVDEYFKRKQTDSFIVNGKTKK